MTLPELARSPPARRKGKNRKATTSQAEAKRRAQQRAQADPVRDRAQALALMKHLNDDAVLTFKQWVCLVGLSPRTGRRILRRGKGPPVIWLSERRMGIRVRAHRAWLAARERGK